MTPNREHWEAIYRTRTEDELSWHQREPRLSLRLIRSVADPQDRIIDIGGGTSPLALRLFQGGFGQVTCLDIADSAIRRAPRSGANSAGVRHVRGDITKVRRLGRFELWHDRAVFHFLTDPAERSAYVSLARRTVPVGGHLIIATFALDGPPSCSGLGVARYDGRALGMEFSEGFQPFQVLREDHRTPWGAHQPFTYVVFRRVRVGAARSGSRSDAPSPSARIDPTRSPPGGERSSGGRSRRNRR